MPLKNSLPLAIFATLIVLLYTPGCAILQTAPETAGFDWQVIGSLIPDLIDSDRLSTVDKIALLEKAKTATTDPAIIARIDREIARQQDKLDKPKPVDPPEIDPTGDEAFFRRLNWLKEPAPDAKVTARLDNLQLNGNRITFDALDIPDWPAGSLGGDLKGNIGIAALRDGRWAGGKFEHIRHGMTHRDLQNVINGYIPGFNIRRGERLRFWLYSYDGQQASNIVEVTY